MTKSPRKKHVWRAYQPGERLLAAYYAGQGETPSEIAKRLGNTTGPRVAALLRRNAGIRFPDRTNTKVRVFADVHPRVKNALAALADKHDLNLDTAVARLLSAIADEPALAANLLDESA